MAELLKIALRGPRCEVEADVAGFQGEFGRLVCDLRPDHPGPLHYDSADLIWWAADA